MPTTILSTRRNLVLLYVFQITSHFWFDGALWVIYWQHRGLSLFEVGLLEALLHLVSLTLDIPMGIVADRIGWKYALMLSSLAGAGYGVCSLLPTPAIAAFLAFGLRGLQITLSSGSDMALTFETVQAAGRTAEYQRISGRMMAAQLVGVGAAEAMGGWIAAHSWTWVYLSFTGANVLALGITLCLKMPTGQFSQTHQDDIRQSLWRIVQNAATFAGKNSSYRKWIAYSAILSGCISIFVFYGQSFLHESGWSTTGIGILTGFECGLSAIASLGSTWVTKRIRAPGLGIITAVGMTLFAWLPGVSKALGYLLTQASGSTSEPLIDWRLNQLVPTANRATLLSANSTAFSIFMVVLFPLFGLLAGHIGSVQTYHIVSTTLLLFTIVGVISLTLMRRKQ